MLSDDVLLYIFNVYRQKSKVAAADDMWPWHAVVHVCKRWRHLIFAWPHLLDLRVACRSASAVAKALDIWPALPISIRSELDGENDDDIITALKHRDRIAGINLSGLTKLQLERCANLMQEPFPLLRVLFLRCAENDAPPITGSFLGGSAPRLQDVKLCNIQILTLPKLLLSTSNLVVLVLRDITRTGYISPDSMASYLAMLTRLHSVAICFHYGISFPQDHTNRCPPLTRAVLPALTTFVFEGSSEYLEDLVARIDAPILSHFQLKFFYQSIFHIPQLPRFICRGESFKPFVEAHVDFCNHFMDICLVPSDEFFFAMRFQPTGFDRQLSLLEQIYTQFSLLLCHVSHLYLRRETNPLPIQPDSALWLGILRPFNAVQILFISGDELELEIPRVLGELAAERAVEVLPMLHTVVLMCPHPVRPLVTSLLKPFIDARRHSDHPVTVTRKGPGCELFEDNG